MFRQEAAWPRIASLEYSGPKARGPMGGGVFKVWWLLPVAKCYPFTTSSKLPLPIFSSPCSSVIKSGRVSGSHLFRLQRITGWREIRKQLLVFTFSTIKPEKVDARSGECSPDCFRLLVRWSWLLFALILLICFKLRCLICGGTPWDAQLTISLGRVPAIIWILYVVEHPLMDTLRTDSWQKLPRWDNKGMFYKCWDRSTQQ